MPFDETGWPLKQRVGRHTPAVMAIFAAFSATSPERPIALKDAVK